MDCGELKTIFGIERCRNCYSRYKESLAPKTKCQCSIECNEMIPSHDESGNPRKLASKHKPKGENNMSWKGGRIKHSKGYWLIHKPQHHFADRDGYVLEHRLVYEEYHKCCLLPWVIIHHINEIKDDNRSENLEVWGRKQHQNIHNPKKGYVKDVSGRICCLCKSDKTYQSYNKQPHWLKHPISNGDWLCVKCYRRWVRNH